MRTRLLLPLFLLLSACGVQGDLYLPDQEAPPPPPEREAPPMEMREDLYEGRY